VGLTVAALKGGSYVTAKGCSSCHQATNYFNLCSAASFHKLHRGGVNAQGALSEHRQGMEGGVISSEQQELVPHCHVQINPDSSSERPQNGLAGGKIYYAKGFRCYRQYRVHDDTGNDSDPLYDVFQEAPVTSRALTSCLIRY
jgi:hypothetical protein